MNILNNNNYKKLPKGMILIFTLMMLLIMVLLGTAVVTSSKFTSNVSFNAASTSEALINADTTLRLSLRAARVFNTNLVNYNFGGYGYEQEAKLIGYCSNQVTKLFNIGYDYNNLPPNGVSFFEDIFYNRRVSDIRYETALLLDEVEGSSKQLPYIRELRLLYLKFENNTSGRIRCPYDGRGDDYVEDHHGNDISEQGMPTFLDSLHQYLGAGAINYNRQTAGDVGGVSMVESGSAISEDITGTPVIIAGVTASGGHDEANAPARGSLTDQYAPIPATADSLPYVFSLPTVLITSFYTVGN